MGRRPHILWMFPFLLIIIRIIRKIAHKSETFPNKYIIYASSDLLLTKK